MNRLRSASVRFRVIFRFRDRLRASNLSGCGLSGDVTKLGKVLIES